MKVIIKADDFFLTGLEQILELLHDYFETGIINL